MKLRQGSWHFQLFVLAYIRDRMWFDDICGFESREHPGLEEVEAHNAIRVKIGKKAWEDITQEEWEELRRREALARSAIGSWFYKDSIVQSEERARILEERLLAGTMSLCPYFWSVVLAVVVYLGVVRPWRVFTGLASRFFRGSYELAIEVSDRTRPARRPVLGLLGLVALLFVEGLAIDNRTAIGESVSDVASVVLAAPGVVASGVGSVHQGWQANRAQKKIEEEARLAWEAANPEVATVQKKARRDRLLRDKVGGLANFATSLLEMGAISIAILLSLSFAIFGGSAFLALFVFLVDDFLACLVESFARLGSLGLWQGFIGFCRARKEGLSRSWAETKELVVAFRKAKKEKFCPFLPVVDEAGEPVTSLEI